MWLFNWDEGMMDNYALAVCMVVGMICAMILLVKVCYVAEERNRRRR